MASRIIKGVDIPLRVTIKGANQSPMAIASLTAMVILLYYEVSGQILSKFSLNEIPGYETIHVIDPSLGLIELRIPASLTKNAQTGRILLEIKMKSTNANWPDGDFETGLNMIEGFELIESRLKDAEY